MFSLALLHYNQFHEKGDKIHYCLLVKSQLVITSVQRIDFECLICFVHLRNDFKTLTLKNVKFVSLIFHLGSSQYMKYKECHYLLLLLEQYGKDLSQYE